MVLSSLLPLPLLILVREELQISSAIWPSRVRAAELFKLSRWWETNEELRGLLLPGNVQINAAFRALLSLVTCLHCVTMGRVGGEGWTSNAGFISNVFSMSCVTSHWRRLICKETRERHSSWAYIVKVGYTSCTINVLVNSCSILPHLHWTNVNSSQFTGPIFFPKKACLCFLFFSSISFLFEKQY